MDCWIFTDKKPCRRCHMGASIILHGGLPVCVCQIAPEIIAVSEKIIFFLAVDQVSKMWARGRALSCDKWSTGCLFHGSKGSPIRSFVFFFLPERHEQRPFRLSYDCVARVRSIRKSYQLSSFFTRVLARRTNLPVKYHESCMY